MFKTVLAAAVLAIAAAPAFADNNGHRGNDSQGSSAAFCPPGLAKRDPACVPPGQAHRGVETEDRVGRHLERDTVTWIERDRYSLPILPSGQRYAVIDNRVVVVDSSTYTVLKFIDLLQNL